KTAWPAAEPAVEVEPDETLWATLTGQVADLGGETVASLNRALLPALLPPRPQLAAREDVERYQGETRRRIRRVTAVGSGVAEEGVPPVQTLTTEAVGTVHLEHLAFQTDAGITIPATFYLPEDGAPRRSRPAVLCVHEGGRAALAGAESTPWLLATR